MHHHDRLVISSAHVKQIERSPRLALFLPQHSSTPIYSVDSLDSSDDSSEESNEEDRQIGVDLASVEIDIIDIGTTTSTTPSPSTTPSHPTVSIGSSTKRHALRRKRWSSDSKATSSTDCTVLLQHNAIQSILTMYWLELCRQGLVDPNDPDKKVRYRIWVIFFRRLCEILPDWDSEDNSLLPGKNKMKLFFTKDEFCNFFFHDILSVSRIIQNIKRRSGTRMEHCSLKFL